MGYCKTPMAPCSAGLHAYPGADLQTVGFPPVAGHCRHCRPVAMHDCRGATGRWTGTCTETVARPCRTCSAPAFPGRDRLNDLAGKGQNATQKAGPRNAQLAGAMLGSCDLPVAKMEGAQLRGANLEDAVVAGNLDRHGFSAARLVRADLSGANLNECAVSRCRYRNRPIFRRATCTPRISAAQDWSGPVSAAPTCAMRYLPVPTCQVLFSQTATGAPLQK